MSRFKPAVHKKWLYWVSGFLWLGVGLGLCLRAVFWVKAEASWWAWGLLILMFLLSFLPGRFLLSRIARRNLKRLDGQPDQICCFAFQPWRSYFIIALMIVMGISLRRSDLPRLYLAMIYALMGGALIFASALYFIRGLEVLRDLQS